MKKLSMVTAVAGGMTLAVTLGLAGRARSAAPEPFWAPRDRGIAATANLDASRAAAEILRKGGNAVDGAVAAALALGVVQPESSGLGGGGFAVVWSAKDKKARVLDFRETAPAKASRDMFVVDGKADPKRWGGLAVAVPGEAAGLGALEEKLGRLGLAATAQPAIRLARGGFAVSHHQFCAIDVKRAGCVPPVQYVPTPPLVDKDPLRPLLLGRGDAELDERALIKRPELARTLEALGRRGPAALYSGAVAKSIVATVQAHGGVLTVEDLAQYKPVWRDAIVGHFRGHEVWTAPAPAGGLTELETLQILDARPPLGPLGRGSSATDHVIAEALKHAFADRARSLGDPAFVKVLEAKLTSVEYARTLAARIGDKTLPPAAYGDKELAGPADAPHDHGTSHLCVADGEGNVVALTTTVNLLFGSRIVDPVSGVVLNDEMDDFSAQPGAPNAFGLIGAFANAVAPGKRPLSSMTPTIVTKDGVPILCVGAAGGPTIVSSTVQTIVDVVDFGLDVSAAVSAPRIHAQWMPNAVVVEPDVPRDVIEALEKRGHKVVPAASLATVQAVGLSPTRLTAASDPRYGGVPAAP
jgi:gamma-glutamyltranspeptidase/glutathione hydrolase